MDDGRWLRAGRVGRPHGLDGAFFVEQPSDDPNWFTRGAKQKELAQVYVDDATGRITEAWTGFQVAWTMARGYSGAFGHQPYLAGSAWPRACPVAVAG